MQLIGRVVFLAVCVFTAHSMPNFGHSPEDNVYEVLVAQVRSALIDTRALTPAESDCANSHNNRTQDINTKLTNQTNSCFENANRTADVNTKNSNATLTSIRADIATVQMQLDNCTRINNTELLLNCLTASHDKNVELLDRINSQATLMTIELKMNQIEMDYTCAACLSIAVDQGKRNLTASANDYNSCLSSISTKHLSESYEIDLPAETPVKVQPVAIEEDKPEVILPADESGDNPALDLNDN